AAPKLSEVLRRLEERFLNQVGGIKTPPQPGVQLDLPCQHAQQVAIALRVPLARRCHVVPYRIRRNWSGNTPREKTDRTLTRVSIRQLVPPRPPDPPASVGYGDQGGFLGRGPLALR